MKPFEKETINTVYLQPGELFIAKRPVIITTLLGSCVSICFHAKAHKVGTMCHCLLPSSSEKATDQPFRYIDQTIKYMILKMREMNIPKEKITSKIFGGADMFGAGPSSGPAVGRLAVGRQNIEKTKNILWDYDIPIEKEHIGGNRGRKIFFHTGTGEVSVHRIGPPNPDQEKNFLGPARQDADAKELPTPVIRHHSQEKEHTAWPEQK